MGKRSKQTQKQRQSQPASSADDSQHGTHGNIVQCISDQLKKLGLCSSDDEYSSISEAIAASASEDVPPSEDDLQNVAESLVEYFEEVTDEDAKAMVYAAAFGAWGENIAHIIPTPDNSDGECDGTENEVDDNDNEAISDFEEDDGGFIGEGECELCERCIKLTRHHLVPKATWPRMKKRLWTAAPLIESLHKLSSKKREANEVKQQQFEEKRELLKFKLDKALGMADISSLPAIITHDSVRSYLTQVALLCRMCHSTVHRAHTEMELATEYNTMERLYECEEVMKFAKWASKQRLGNCNMRQPR